MSLSSLFMLFWIEIIKWKVDSDFFVVCGIFDLPFYFHSERYTRNKGWYYGVDCIEGSIIIVLKRTYAFFKKKLSYFLLTNRAAMFIKIIRKHKKRMCLIRLN